MTTRKSWCRGTAARCAMLIALLGAAGCAHGPRASPTEDLAARTAVVPEGKAALYLIRPAKWRGSAVLYRLMVDGESQTYLGYRNYAFKVVAPGVHTITAYCSCPKPVQKTIKAKSTETKFLSVESLGIAELTPAKGREMLKDLQLVRWVR